jgi:hypothetical protein
MEIEKLGYGGWENCARLSNGRVELVVTLDVGPRIIRYGFVGKENEFCEIRPQLGLTGGQEWRIYAGDGDPLAAPEAYPECRRRTPGRVGVV